MPDTYKELEKSFRDISWWDRVCAYFCKDPSLLENACSVYDEWLNSKLDDMDINTLDVTEYSTAFLTKGGEKVKLWTANYPYSYGRYDGFDDNKRGKYPYWTTILRLREIQLTKKQEVLDDYRNKINKRCL